jgi:hypothetical protein
MIGSDLGIKATVFDIVNMVGRAVHPIYKLEQNKGNEQFSKGTKLN